MNFYTRLVQRESWMDDWIGNNCQLFVPLVEFQKVFVAALMLKSFSPETENNITFYCFQQLIEHVIDSGDRY